MADHPKQKSKGKLRGLPKDSSEVRISKTLSWILRHGAQSEKLYMRPDGFVRVSELLATPKLRTQLDFAGLQTIVENDTKQRYTLMSGPDEAALDAGDIWWIRANQGHSMKPERTIAESETGSQTDPIITDIPMAVHGTNENAWRSISTQGLSKMTRNHIHLAQGVPGDGVISGMRTSAQVLIYIDVQKALDAGIPFSLSDNGVVLTEGDAEGFLRPEFFGRVEDRSGRPIAGWSPVSTTAQATENITSSHVAEV